MTQEEEKSKIRSKARKLKALANGGVDGEKETARRMYDDYIKEHGLQDNEISSNMHQREFYNLVDLDECDIAATIILSVNPFAKYNVTKEFVSSELDDEDYLEAKEKIDYFIKLWRIERNALRTAFAIRHNDFFRPDDYASSKWREHKSSNNEVAKNEFNDMDEKAKKIKFDFKKNPNKVIKDVFETNDEALKTAFNLDRSLQMSEILLVAHYKKVKRTIKNNKNDR
jgi:hypothetical protein